MVFQDPQANLDMFVKSDGLGLFLVTGKVLDARLRGATRRMTDTPQEGANEGFGRAFDMSYVRPELTSKAGRM